MDLDWLEARVDVLEAQLAALNARLTDLEAEAERAELVANDAEVAEEGEGRGSRPVWADPDQWRQREGETTAGVCDRLDLLARQREADLAANPALRAWHARVSDELRRLWHHVDKS